MTGVLGALIAGIVQITAKRMRNARYVRRGEPPVKDVIFTPLFPVYAVLGLVSGLAGAWFADGWLGGAVGGLAFPALATLGWLSWGASQLRG